MHETLINAGLYVVFALGVLEALLLISLLVFLVSVLFEPISAGVVGVARAIRKPGFVGCLLVLTIAGGAFELNKMQATITADQKAIQELEDRADANGSLVLEEEQNRLRDQRGLEHEIEKLRSQLSAGKAGHVKTPAADETAPPIVVTSASNAPLEVELGLPRAFSDEHAIWVPRIGSGPTITICTRDGTVGECP
jgi:hypothetical protein